MVLRYLKPQDRGNTERASAAYRTAFQQYLRYGTPIRLEAKAAAPSSTSHYIWRTQHDERVRPSHAANDGNIYAFENPPATGNPGVAYGCRCRAEPYDASTGEYFDIEMKMPPDAEYEWQNIDFVNHYFFSQGKTVTVEQTGHLDEIVQEFRRIAIDNPARLPGQVADAARKSRSFSFRGDFTQSYAMLKIVFSIGDTAIHGEFYGDIRHSREMLELSGTMDFTLRDSFRDPIDIEEFVYDQIKKIYDLVIVAELRGLDEASAIADFVASRLGWEKFRQGASLIKVVARIMRIGQDILHVGIDNLPRELLFGTPYGIISEWSAIFQGRVDRDVSRSRYRR